MLTSSVSQLWKKKKTHFWPMGLSRHLLGKILRRLVAFLIKRDRCSQHKVLQPEELKGSRSEPESFMALLINWTDTGEQPHPSFVYKKINLIQSCCFKPIIFTQTQRLSAHAYSLPVSQKQIEPNLIKYGLAYLNLWWQTVLKLSWTSLVKIKIYQKPKNNIFKRK